jgi:hypothetical protein
VDDVTEEEAYPRCGLKAPKPPRWAEGVRLTNDVSIDSPVSPPATSEDALTEVVCDEALLLPALAIDTEVDSWLEAHGQVVGIGRMPTRTSGSPLSAIGKALRPTDCPASSTDADMPLRKNEKRSSVSGAVSVASSARVFSRRGCGRRGFAG